MSRDSTYYAGDQAAWPVLGTSGNAMNVRLTENDRRAVDMLLGGEMAEEALDASMLERVNTVKRMLSILHEMPAEEPSASLTDMVMRKIAASQAAASQQHDSKPAAEL